MSPLRIIFAGTPEFAVPSLEALLAVGQDIVAVYTQPDRPAGRGRKLSPSPVKAAALAQGLPVLQPPTLRDETAVAELRALAADLMVVVAYGLLLPQAVLDAPRLGCVNVHASLLPRWRGAAPIQRALLAGDTESGVTIMRMAAGLDTGPAYLLRPLTIASRETGGSLGDKLARQGAQALVEALPGIANGSLIPVPQDDSQANYAHKLAKAEAEVDWSRPAVEIDRLIRALDPWPVAQTQFEGSSLRLWGSELTDLAPPPEALPGQVLAVGKGGIAVATGVGVLRLTRLQPPGKRPMSAAEFLNARRLDGVRLG